MSDTAIAASVSIRQQELLTWAHQTFPGLNDVRTRHSIVTFNTQAPILSGYWNGVLLGFRDTPERNMAHVLVHCRCCDRYTSVTPVAATAHALYSAADLARNFPHGPIPTQMSQCDQCRWLHIAQKHAAKANSRIARWWFRKTRGVGVFDVLLAHRATHPRHH